MAFFLYLFSIICPHVIEPKNFSSMVNVIWFGIILWWYTMVLYWHWLCLSFKFVQKTTVQLLNYSIFNYYQELFTKKSEFLLNSKWTLDLLGVFWARNKIKKYLGHIWVSWCFAILFVAYPRYKFVPILQNIKHLISKQKNT